MTSLFKSLIAIVLLSHMPLSFANTQPNIDLTEAVKKIQQQLPQELSSNLLLTDVNYDITKQTLTYVATALDTESNQISKDKIINQVCYNPMLRKAIKQGITVSFFYYAINKELLKHAVITEALCESNFKVFEGLLEKDITELKANSLPEALNNQLALFNLNYQSAQQRLIVDIKATNNQVNLDGLGKDYSISLACNHSYFSALVERNLNFTFNYFNQQGNQIVKTFEVTARECQPKNPKDTYLKDDLDRQLAQEALSMKKNLKALSTKQIELTDVGYNPEQRLIWNKAVIKDANITVDKLNPQLNIASACTNPVTRQTIAKGISYQYSYYDESNALLANIVIDSAVCKRYDQTNNLLLQKK